MIYSILNAIVTIFVLSCLLVFEPKPECSGIIPGFSFRNYSWQAQESSGMLGIQLGSTVYKANKCYTCCAITPGFWLPVLMV